MSCERLSVHAVWVCVYHCVWDSAFLICLCSHPLFSPLLPFLPPFPSVLSTPTAYEKRVKTQRLKLEMTAAKKDVDFYLSKVDMAGKIDKMEARKLAQGTTTPQTVESERNKVRVFVMCE